MTTTTSPARAKARLDWVNLPILSVVHLGAAFALVYPWVFHFSWWTLGLGAVWYLASGMAITAGYHRLFAHRAYRASWPVRAFILLFGAAAVQNSALKWTADHRRHHADTDGEGDPYNIRLGFWWAHIGWVLYRDDAERLDNVADLASDRLLAFQHKHYVALAVLMTVVLPAALGALWGDALGAMLIAGLLRLAVQWHATFFVNSMAHTVGRQPFTRDVSARDSLWTALITFGEGYHNFHHRFQGDYRCGARWHHFDPTKWFIWNLSTVGLVAELKRTSTDRIRKARESLKTLELQPALVRAPLEVERPRRSAARTGQSSEFESGRARV